MSSKIKVLIVDDSAVVRAKLSEILATDPDLEVIGTASDPFIAVQRMEEVTPDVMTLDLEMPRMDGLTFLEKIMSQHPIPVVICSSMADVNSDNFIKALNLGAVDILHKPKIGTKQFLEESRVQICDTVKGAAKAKVISRTMQVAPKLTADAVLAKAKPFSTFQTTEKIIVIGASTGGTEALRYLLPQFPRDCPGIVVVQHMPELFTRSFAKSLNDMCSIEVKEAQDNDTILRGQALIAPGGSSHLMVKRSGARYFVEIKEGPLVNRHRPSVDVMFRSAARYAGPNTIGLLLTGMGDDGAAGLLEILQAGGKTFAQDEASSVVFGMPRVAIELGAAEKIVGLTEATQKILQSCC